jgi:hypothetical protein
MFSAPTKLSDPDKLQALRQLDQFRGWHSLDDKRYCLVCGKIITGREIQLVRGSRRNGPLRLTCPTERCNSIPMDWVFPTDGSGLFLPITSSGRDIYGKKRSERALDPE